MLSSCSGNKVGRGNHNPEELSVLGRLVVQDGLLALQTHCRAEARAFAPAALRELLL